MLSTQCRNDGTYCFIKIRELLATATRRFSKLGSRVPGGISFLLSFRGGICCKARSLWHAVCSVQPIFYIWQKDSGTAVKTPNSLVFSYTLTELWRCWEYRVRAGSCWTVWLSGSNFNSYSACCGQLPCTSTRVASLALTFIDLIDILVVELWRREQVHLHDWNWKCLLMFVKRAKWAQSSAVKSKRSHRINGKGGVWLRVK